MATSIFPKMEEVHRQVGSISSAAGGAVSRVHLNRDSLINEHTLIISVSQTYAGAPTSVEAGRFIDTLSVETDDGNLFRCSGVGGYLLESFYEKQSQVESVLQVGVCTAIFAIDLHYEMPEALRDMLTSVEASDLSNFDLVIGWASDTVNGFIGGAGAAADLSYNCSVISKDMPDMQGIGLDDETAHSGVGQFSRFVEEQNRPAASAGSQAPVRLLIGNNTRAVALIVEDTTGGAYVSQRNDILTNVRLVLGGKERRKLSFDAIRFDNVARRGSSVVGMAVLDFKDDETGFLNLENVAEALLEFDAVLPAGVTNFNVRILQDYIRG